jgi:hypothetical protein
MSDPETIKLDGSSHEQAARNLSAASASPQATVVNHESRIVDTESGSC